MKKLGTDARLKKKLQEVLDLNVAENAAMDNANNPSASNPFATLADLPEGGGITDVTYDELLALMDSSGDGLVPGQFYRITDFATVHYMVDYKTATADINTGSTEPLIVLAISESALDSRAYSELYPYDVIHYDWNPANWLTDVSFGGNDETLVTGFKGVIYFRHDTLHDNYMGYDFRNVKFRRWNNGFEVGDAWLSEYQSYKSNGAGVTDPEDYIDVLTFNCPGGEEQYNNEVRGIHIEAFKDQSDLSYDANSILCNNVFYLEADYGWYQVLTNTIGSLSCFNTFNGYIEANIIGNDFHSNIIGNNFYNNTIENDFRSNTIGDYFCNNIIGNVFHSNIIGNGFSSNIIGNGFYGNTIGNNFYNNIIGNDFHSNTIGNYFYSNTIENGFYGNTIGDSCQNITAENNVTLITIADSCTNIRIGNSSSYIELGDSSGGVNNIDIGQGCGGKGLGIVIGGGCSDIEVGNGCGTINIGSTSSYITIGNSISTINIGIGNFHCFFSENSSEITIGDYCENLFFRGGCNSDIVIGDSVRFLTVNTSFMIVVGNQSTSNSFYMCQSITIPEKSFCNEFKGCLTKDYTDSLINQITNGVFITHQPITSSYAPQPVSDIAEIYIEEDSEGLHQIITRDIIGVAV